MTVYTPPSQWLATLDADGVPIPPGLRVNDPILQWAPPPHATIDWETYSEAGLHLTDGKYLSMHGSNKPSDKGLRGVGSAVYARHPTTEILTLSYRIPGGPLKRWRPGQPLPQDLFDWIAAGGLVEAHNVMFERLIWQYVATPRHGFPPVPPSQWRCSMAKARVNALPGALGDLTAVLQTPIVKDADGKRLLDKFSVPRKPTKTDPRLRIRPEDDPADAERLYGYCDVDVQSEELASGAMLPMTTAEVEFWQCDQEINWRGVGVDVEGVRACIIILEQVFEKYTGEYAALTGGLAPSQLEATKGWLLAHGVHMTSMDEDALDAALATDTLPADARRVLEIRQLTGSASVKKLYSMERMATPEGRLCNLLVHHGARTGRASGEGPQPQNLPKDGPDLQWCGACHKPSGRHAVVCPWCGVPVSPAARRSKWTWEAVEDVLEIMRAGSVDTVEMFYGDALLAISGCVRSLFIAAEGHDLIASDFTAIEAVVAAALAGEEWRLDVFRKGIDIYLASAEKITGRSLAFYEAYKAEHGVAHADRQKVGKVAELALGFGGWIGGWRGFDNTNTFTDDQVKQNIIAWRDASPAIVEMWGGQGRGWPGNRNYVAECYGLEGIFVQAIRYPGQTFTYRGISATVRGDALALRLLSGREIMYQQPRLTPSTRRQGETAITYMTWNTNPKYGPTGWVCMSTYSGKIFENVVQATAHDVLRYAILGLRAAGYSTVLHVHDEIILEVAQGFGSIEEVEAIMARMPPWAEGWPIRASGGWRGPRYRKG